MTDTPERRRPTSADRADQIAACDPVWARVRQEAAEFAAAEPILASFVHATILNHERLEGALSYHLAQKLANADAPAILIRQVVAEALSDAPTIGEAARADLSAVFERDPACRTYAQALLYFKGFHALQTHRVAHWLWQRGREAMAFFLQNRVTEVFGVDIHPAARMGRAIMMDHATGIVIGETAVVEDDVSMLHSVTLGGTGKEHEDRHPKIRRGVLIGAGAKILGNIEVGEYARVAACSVVLKSVPGHCTVAGIPAKVVGCAGGPHPSHDMDHRFNGNETGEGGEGI